MGSHTIPKILYLEIDEEVISIIDRIKKIRNKVVILVIPNRAVILQSIINLKLLKKQMEKLEKEMYIVTTDKTGRNLASQIGITVYSTVDEKYSESKVKNKIKPITIKENDEKDNNSLVNNDVEIIEESDDYEEEVTTYMDEKKKFGVSALEKSKKLWKMAGVGKENKVDVAARFNEDIERDKNLNDFKYKDFVVKDNDEQDEKDSNVVSDVVRYKQNEDSYNVTTLKILSPNKKLLFFMSFLALCVLFVVGYFVLPKATIMVQPKMEPISYTTTVTLLDVNRYGGLLNDGKKLKMIGSYPIEVRESITDEAVATGKSFIGQRSTGKIRVRNKVARTWDFIKNTRFSTQDGIVFRSVSAVILPPSAEVIIEVIADEYDVDGNPIGSRGNVKDVEFFVPGLGTMSPSYVDGIAEGEFVGGTDEFETVVMKGDIKVAKELVVEKLFEIAEQKVVERIEKENREKGKTLRLFKTGNNDTDIRKEVLEVIVDNGLVGKVQDKFPIAAKARLNGYAYDINEIVSIMENGLSDLVLDNRELVEVKTDNIEFHVVENLPGEQKVKVEATLYGVTKYAVDDRLTDKIKGQILGKSLDEAVNIVDNMAEVESVLIDPWPKMWVKWIPGTRSNIYVEELKES